MTAPLPSRRARWYARPGVVLPIVSALVLLTALLVPEGTAGRAGDDRLSTYSTEPLGAHLFSELAKRLGWVADQRRTAELPPEPGLIHAVLDPAVPLRMGEAHELLERVRRGDALLLIIGERGDAVADSLHVRLGPGGYYSPPADADTTACHGQPQSIVPLWLDNRVHLFSLIWRGGLAPARSVTFIRLDERGPGSAPVRWRQVAVGFPYGRGRIVVGSDADLLRNDALRVCDYGLDVPAVRMLEYLRDGGAAPRRRIVFDEFHQGFGTQPGTVRTIASYLSGTSSGHLLFQCLAAGLVLLLSMAPRAIPPRDPERVERRSPFEHVNALGRAYGQVGATRTATARLVRGLRRRLERGAIHAGTMSDDAFLRRAEQTVPALAPDVAMIRRALTARVSRLEFSKLGAALARVETSLTRI